MNSIEDECFGNFCAQIGVSNIRQYEERELRYLSGLYEIIDILIKAFIENEFVILYFRTQQEREQKKIEFQNQKDQIYAQIEFEQSRAESGMCRFKYKQLVMAM